MPEPMHARSVRAIQTAFGAALRDRDRESGVLAAFAGDARRNAERLGVYRANAIANATSALRTAYPVCAQLVGDTFFDALARAYWQSHPSTHGDLGEYGAALAQFIAGFQHTRSLPYLADVTRLEWAVHRAASAPDAPRAPIAREPALLWWPGTQVLAFDHPAADIWLAHQPHAPVMLEEIAPRAQGALVHRDGLAVKVATLAYDEAMALIELVESGDAQ